MNCLDRKFERTRQLKDLSPSSNSCKLKRRIGKLAYLSGLAIRKRKETWINERCQLGCAVESVRVIQMLPTLKFV